MRAAAMALWWRDLLALWRLERSLVLGALFVSGPAWAVQHAAVANYPLAGESATRAGLLVLTIAGSVAASAVLALPGHLGRQLDPRRAPFTPAARASLLAAVAAGLGLPTLIAVFAGGSEGPLRLVTQLLAASAGAAWFAVGLGRRTDADRTTYLWWLLVLCGLAFVPSPGQPLGALALTALAAWGTSRTLARARRLP
ncbi:MAG: hypothetical protein EP330_12755 [Deltaproteobacteria bacterium]|nr:MAG: hypothetical protein EP330_12755 [Deltaproteobacteria bacterium]